MGQCCFLASYIVLVVSHVNVLDFIGGNLDALIHIHQITPSDFIYKQIYKKVISLKKVSKCI
jgi:hypothetical protein